MIRKALGPRTWLALAVSSYSLPSLRPLQPLPLHETNPHLVSYFGGQTAKYYFSDKKKPNNNNNDNDKKN